MIKIVKLFFILAILFFSSCVKDGDKLVSSEGFNVGTYFVDANYNNNPIFKADYTGTSWNDLSEIYREINPYSNTPVFDGEKIDVNVLFNMNVGPFQLKNFQLADVEINFLSRKKIYFDDAIINEQTSLNVSELNINNSYIQIDTLILPSSTIVLPRIIGSLYLESSSSSNPDRLEITKFELPFNNN